MSKFPRAAIPGVVIVVLSLIGLMQLDSLSSSASIARYISYSGRSPSAGISTEVRRDGNGAHFLDVVTDRTHGKYQYIAENQKVLDDLSLCQESGTCTEHQPKIIIIVSIWCSLTMYDNYMGGEGVWCRAIVRALRRQGYNSILFARGGEDWSYAYELYRALPDNVHLVIGDTPEEAKNWYKSARRPDGIPAWKHLRFTSFPSSWGNTVGNEWSVTQMEIRDKIPMNYTYLGHEILCDPKAVLPWSQRKPQVWVLGKRVLYFHEPEVGAWPVSFYERATRDLRRDFHPDFEFVGTYVDDTTTTDEARIGFRPSPVIPGVRTIGKVTPEEYHHHMSSSRAMLGIGKPGSSPSPYEALCLGMPFINPHFERENKDPADRLEWQHVQHGPLKFEDPPLVYQTKARDYDAFMKTLKAALTTPMEMHQYPHLTLEAMDERMRFILNRDWRSLAEETLARRLAGVDPRDNRGSIFEM